MKFNVDKVEFNEAELEKIDVKNLFCENHEVVVQTLEKLKEVTKNPIFDFIIELAIDVEAKVYSKTCTVSV